MQTRYLYLLRYILPFVDLVVLNSAYFLTYYLTGLYDKVSHQELNINFIVVCNLIWVINSTISGLYTPYSNRNLERIYRSTFKCIILHIALFALYLFFNKEQNFSRVFIVVFYPLLGFLFICNRFLGTAFQFIITDKFKGTKRVAIIGDNSTGANLAGYLEKHSHIDFYGFLDINRENYFENGLVSARISMELQKALDNQVNFVYVSIHTQEIPKIPLLLEEAEKIGIRLKFIPDIEGSLAVPFTLSYLGGEFPVISLRTEPLEDVGARLKKRIFDLIFSSLAFIFILSWLFPIIAILIKLDSKGPVFFMQNRAGRNNRNFKVFKFRTMTVTESDTEYKQAQKGDARITKIGAFLRRTSLDELPQFINVLYGNMSVVGPRPHPLLLNEYYQEIISKYMIRHYVKPGITGWAQANGYRGETNDPQLMVRRVEHDIWYLENWTLMLDVKIVFMTIINMIKGEENAY